MPCIPLAGLRLARPIAVFVLAWVLLVSARCTLPIGQPSIIFILVDTLRPDYLGCYGFQGPVSPHVDALAHESYAFCRAYASAPWTKPSVASIFTSLSPLAHGVTNHEGAMWGGNAPDLRKGVLRPDAYTLAERLKARGYATAAFVANPWLTWQYGFDQGFDVYNSVVDPPADRVGTEAQRWLESFGDKEPFFLYVHLLDVHSPYNAADSTYELVRSSPSVRSDETLSDEEWTRIPPSIMRAAWARDASGAPRPETRRVDTWRGRYAAEVRDLDDRLGPFLGYLESKGYLDRAYLVFTSDHGEALHDHEQWDHGYSLFEDQIHVPLLIRPPGGLPATKEIPNVVGLVDLLPTLLAWSGEAPEDVEGRDLGPLLSGAGPGGSEVVFSGGVRVNPLLYAVTTGPYKLLVDQANQRHALFDVVQDPAEDRNLAERSDEVVSELWAYLDEFLKTARARPLFEAVTPEVSPDHEELLRSLGYMN
jgi:arylsulfatase A-like enzyme